jgi:hypothetical protein
MTEQRTEQHSPETPQQRLARKPFVKPVVHDLGGLSQLTLAGGSVP